MLRRIVLLLIVTAWMSHAPGLFAQTTPSNTSLRVFLDCSYACDNRFIHDELPIVDWVTESKEADVHILYTYQQTGGLGLRTTLTFVGQREYAAMADTLTFSTGGDATRDDDRRALVRSLGIGLARFLARAGMSDRITIVAVKPTSTAETASVNSIQSDPWNYWVFSLSGNGMANGQATTSSSYRRGSISANRTTEALKVRFSGSLNDTRSEFKAGEDVIESRTHSEYITSQVVRSIGAKWAVGATGSVSASSYQNTKLQMALGPAIEYDLFPYSQSASKMLTVQYSMTLSSRRYEHLTIFALDHETILRHSLGAVLSLTQKWGSISVSTSLNHMLTNFDRSLLDTYNLGGYGNASVRLFRGLSLTTSVSYNRIRDQIDLPAEEATREEILLRSKQLPTGYSYFVNWGLTYRFGSIFNNVVNPRMGGGSQMY